MARFVSRPDLDAVIARTVGLRAVERLKRDVADGARRRAPDGKAWVSMADARVRPSHTEAHAQLIPENLRYKVRRMTYLRKGRNPATRKAANPAGGWRKSAGYELGREPRDPDLSKENREGCRCRSVVVPGAVARSIVAGPTVPQGTRVEAEVATRFPRAAESEFGTSEDRAARFMSDAAREAAAALRAAASRRR